MCIAAKNEKLEDGSLRQQVLANFGIRTVRVRKWINRQTDSCCSCYTVRCCCCCFIYDDFILHNQYCVVGNCNQVEVIDDIVQKICQRIRSLNLTAVSDDEKKECKKRNLIKEELVL